LIIGIRRFLTVESRKK
jgi:hypothetical protein